MQTLALSCELATRDLRKLFAHVWKNELRVYDEYFSWLRYCSAWALVVGLLLLVADRLYRSYQG